MGDISVMAAHGNVNIGAGGSEGSVNVAADSYVAVASETSNVEITANTDVAISADAVQMTSADALNMLGTSGVDLVSADQLQLRSGSTGGPSITLMPSTGVDLFARA